jgi:hypothetical protein
MANGPALKGEIISYSFKTTPKKGELICLIILIYKFK